MTDDKPRRSRTAWPGPMSIAGIEPGHEHELPLPLVQRVRLLTRAGVIFGVCLAALVTLLVLIILELTEQRDREQAALEREIRESWCTALDTLPEGGLSLDRLRAQYGCGPGRPIEDLTQEERAELAGRAPAVVVPPAEPSPAVIPEPDRMGGAGPNPPRPSAAEPPPPESAPQPSPAPSPEPGPLVVPAPIAEPVCEGLRVCL